MTFEEWEQTDGCTVSLNFGAELSASIGDLKLCTQSAYNAGYRAGLERAAETLLGN